MTAFGGSEPACNALRQSCSVLRTSPLVSRPYIVNRIRKMTATPPRNIRLWHPARGISFSPGPALFASPTHNPRAATKASTGAGQYHVATTPSADPQGEDIWATTVAQQMTPSNVNLQKPAEDAYTLVPVPSTVEAKAEEEVKEAENIVTNNPPPPVLEYKMVDDQFYEAKKSPPGSPKSFWSYKQYRRTAEDGTSHRVVVHYCRSRKTMEQVCKQFFMNEKVLGFDLEWMTEPTQLSKLKKNVSLIQLASPSRIGLFHVAVFPDKEDMVGPSFKSIMEDPDIIKAGVWVKGDATRVRNHLDIHSRGLIELSHLYKLVTYSRTRQYHKIDRRLVPLATQVEEYLHLPLFKGQDVRSSDWSKTLSMDQVKYAGSDAYAGVQLYATLDHHRKQLDPCPPLPHYAELGLAIQLAEGVKVNRPDNTAEGDDVVTSNGGTSTSSEKCLAAAIDDISIEDKGITSPVPKVKIATPKSPARPKDSRIEVAEDRVTAYRASHPQSRSKFAQLRSYYLWHCYDLSPEAIAQLLRDPPLKTVTVVQYILSVVQAEKLPVDHDRLREVAGLITQSALWARWPVVAGMIAASDG